MIASESDVTQDDLPAFDRPPTPEPAVQPQIPALDWLPLDRLAAATVGPWSEARHLFERLYVARILAAADGNQSEAARLAGMSRSAFRDLLKRTHETA